MMEVLKQKLSLLKTAEEKYHFLREYLQCLILKILDEKGFFQNLSFVGGTALRILYQLDRFSEDLDFCLTNKKGYDFANMMKVLEKELQAYGFEVNIHYKDKKTVASAFIKFHHLLYSLNFKVPQDQKISIKFEVDQNPPSGFKTTFTMVNQDFLIGIQHFDLPSLFAGKLHALLCRTYAKGRDYYDFMWYISKKISPNYLLLNNSILQTEHENKNLSHESLIQTLIQHFEKINFKKIKEDVAPFLADQKEVRFFEKGIFIQLAKQLL